MNIAGIEREKALGWDNKEIQGVSSFLDGLESTRMREDSMIINDLMNIPGFDLIKHSKFSSSIFKNGNTQLTVLLANRFPLEELLGTDLIYFNEDNQCFVMVQYKVMEKEGQKFLFRLPNTQFTEEINRMNSITTMLNPIQNENNIQDFRISNKPFFIKFCPRIEFEPDDTSLSSGMYVPLEYLKLLQNDKSIQGPYGGRSISYENIGRYFNNTSFKTIIEGGWIGTHKNQSLVLKKLIRDILVNGKTVVLAIKKNLAENKRSIFDDIPLTDT